jgi:quinol monooxygenase YgiN
MPEIVPAAVVITIRTLPGKRGELRAVWEQHLAPRVLDSQAQQVYVVVEDSGDHDVLHLLEVYSDGAQMARNGAQPWFAQYMAAAAPLLAGPPVVASGLPVWVKPALT